VFVELMKITSISTQIKNQNRVNVSVDGAYKFSLDLYQLSDLGIKVGSEYSAEELNDLLQESEFGKLYVRALDYALMRPHSQKEVRDYLWKKTRPSKYKSRATGEIKDRAGVSQSSATRALERLIEKGYVDDEKFCRYWVENRSVIKGVSRRKLVQELRQKGISQTIIDVCLDDSERTDIDELKKIIAKKQSKYEDSQKFMVYLVRQGFSYDDVKSAMQDKL
jgi:regulatory protein